MSEDIACAIIAIGTIVLYAIWDIWRAEDGK